MLTKRRTPRIADEQPSDGWDDTRFWVGTFGVFFTTFVLGRVLLPFVASPPGWVQTGRPVPATVLVVFIVFAAWTGRCGWDSRYDPWATLGQGDRHRRDRVQKILATRRSP